MLFWCLRNLTIMSELSDINVKLRIEAISLALRNHPDLLEEILNHNRDGINLESTPDNLDCSEPFNTLVRVAWDIWNGTGETEFDMVLELLPAADFCAFVEAMKKFSQLRDRIYHSYASGSEND